MMARRLAFTMHEERLLLERLRTGTPAGGPGDDDFRRLFDRYGRAVYAFFANRGFSREESLDLTQETFLRVYKSIGGFRGEVEFKSWLLRIAANLWKNEVRRRSADKRDAIEVSLEDDAAGAARAAAGAGRLAATRPDPLDEALAAERVRVVHALVRQLPPQMRRCVLLRIGQELKYQEIAGVMQLSIDTVKSQLAQARQRLKSELDRHFAAGGTG